MIENNSQAAERPMLPRRYVRALHELISHTLLIVLALSCIWLVEQVCIFLWNDEKHFFDAVPLGMIFDFFDLATLTVYLAYGLLGAVRAFNASVADAIPQNPRGGGNDGE